MIYQINAYIKDADKLAYIYSELHRNVQEVFNKEEIELVSPAYMATRDGNATTIPQPEKKD